MQNLFTILTVAIALSMDAFGISIVYGTIGMSKLRSYLTSIVVGIYHFFMPLLGFLFGHYIIEKLPIKPNIVVGIIFILISLQMLFEKHNENKIKKLNIAHILLFGFSVSIDSFTVGIGLNALTNNYLLSVSIFAITSALFTLTGLICGRKINYNIGDYSTKLGALILLILSLFYITN